MAEQDPHILELVKLAGAGQKGFDTRIKEIKFTWPSNGIQVEGSFFYLAYKDGEPAQNEFVNYIYHQIIPFCLKRPYYRESFKKISENEDHQLMVKIVDEAKNLFIEAKKKNKKTGEPGEVILFSLLENVLNAPRVLSKMNLKTDRNMEVYGSDGIHFRYDKDTSKLLLYWGESKLYKNFANSLSKIVSSIKTFTVKDDKGNTERDFDISLITQHADLDSESATAELLAYLDPYDKKYEDLREIYACLSVWDCDIYEKIKNESRDKIEDLFKEKYLEHITNTCSSFEGKLKANGLEKLSFHLFLIPIKNVMDLRKQFCTKIGVPFDEADYPESEDE